MREVPAPIIRPDEVLVRIRRIGICGTDLHAFEGTQPYFSYPRVLGHELSGDIEAVGDEAIDFHKGEKVTILPYMACHSCIACRNGKTNCCVNMKVMGVHADGGFCEYVSVPSRSVFHGGDMTRCDLALVEPLSIGAHAVRLAAVQPDENVLVIGAGPIGIAVAAVAGSLGAKVIVMDVNQERLDFVRNNYHIDHTINVLDNPVEELKSLTDGDFVPVQFDVTGNLKAIENGLQFLAHGGRYILVGLQREPFCFSHPDFHKRETLMQSSRNATREDFETVISMIQNGKIDPAPMVTHKLEFDNLPAEFPGLLDPSSKVIKALVFID